MPRLPRKPFVQLHLAVFLAGFTGVLGKLIDLNEWLLVLYRLLISAFTMWVYFTWKRAIKKIEFRDKLGILLLGLIAALHWTFFYGAIKLSGIAIALICFSAVGFFSSFLEPIINRRPFSAVEVALGLLVMVGIAVIFQFETGHREGIVYGIFSAFLGALFPIYNRIYMQRMDAPTLMTWELTGGAVWLCLIVPFMMSNSPSLKLMPNMNDFCWLLVLSWACSVWAFQLSSNALKSISAFTVNLTYNLEPVYGILLAFLLYKENRLLGAAFYFGVFLIVLAVSIQTIRTVRKS